MDITNPVQELISRKLYGMISMMQVMAGRAEAEMKEKAPWNDRTTNARNGLFSEVIFDENAYTFALSHGMEYGVFLEKANNGKYSIVKPTADIYGDKLKRFVKDWWSSS